MDQNRSDQPEGAPVVQDVPKALSSLRVPTYTAPWISPAPPQP